MEAAYPEPLTGPELIRFDITINFYWEPAVQEEGVVDVNSFLEACLGRRVRGGRPRDRWVLLI